MLMRFLRPASLLFCFACHSVAPVAPAELRSGQLKRLVLIDAQGPEEATEAVLRQLLLGLRPHPEELRPYEDPDQKLRPLVVVDHRALQKTSATTTGAEVALQEGDVALTIEVLDSHVNYSQHPYQLRAIDAWIPLRIRLSDRSGEIMLEATYEGHFTNPKEDDDEPAVLGGAAHNAVRKFFEHLGR